MAIMPDTVSGSQSLFALTICAYRKSGMDEEAYHEYLSKKHAPLLKDLMARNKIVEYTMQHNTSQTKKMLGPMFAALPESNVENYDCFIHIVFKDVQDFINVKNDPHYSQVVVPDHRNFADHERTKMVTGWYEKHIVEGRAVAAEAGIETNEVNGH